jgi:hypothetical protein
MKLQELLSEIFSSGEYPKVNSRFGIVDGTIYGEDLEQFKERILQTEEFADCKELIIMKHPIIAVENGKTVQNVTYKHKEGQKYKGKCYLLSLALTPEMFDPKMMHTPVLDGACITPTMYDPTTFEPKKKIVLEFSPEMAQDQDIYAIGNPSMIEAAEKNGESILRKQLHETLDKILDNPENYQVKGEKGLLVRGYFEEVHSTSGVEKTDLVGINPEKQTHMTAYFFEKDEKNSKEGQVNLKLSSMPIPIELHDKFTEELGPKSVNVTREEVEEFLKRYQ